MNQMTQNGRSTPKNEQLKEGVRRAKTEISRLDERIINFARAQPLAAALSAVAAGFILGRLFSRRY